MASSNPQVRLNSETVERIDEWRAKLPLAVTRQAIVEKAVAEFLENHATGIELGKSKKQTHYYNQQDAVPAWLDQGMN